MMFFLSMIFLAATSTGVAPPAPHINVPTVTIPQVPTPTINKPAPPASTTPTTAPNIRPAEPFPSTQPIGAIFTSPGVATLQGGRWVGSEHLYNLDKDFGVVVEIIQPPGLNLGLSETLIRDKVIALLSSAGLHPRTTLSTKQTPLPFLHILLMINPIERGYVVYFAARMFEAVKVDRTNLRVDLTWQAITWEKQEMLIFGTEQLQTELFKTIDSMISSFNDKIKSYQNLK